MSGDIEHYEHSTYPNCVMTRDDTAAVYSFPFSGFPVCLILHSPHILIPALDELLELISFIDENSDVILKIQVYDNQVEFHFDELDSLSVSLILTFISSKYFYEIGNWSFRASGMIYNIREIMNLLDSKPTEYFTEP